MPFKKDGSREYRSFSLEAQTSDEGSKAYRVRGYATTFDVPYDFGFGDAKEQVSSKALIGADMSDVIFQLNHEGLVLARMSNGSLTLTADDHGLLVDADLSGTAQGRDLYEAIANKLITKMSWGFTIAKDGWEWDEDTRTSTITKVSKVFDVSAVSLPADADTEIHARSYFNGVIEKEQEECLQRERDRRKRIAVATRMR